MTIIRGSILRTITSSPKELLMTTRLCSLFPTAGILATAAQTLVADEPQLDTMVLRKLQGHWTAEKWGIHGKDTSEGRDNRSYRIDSRKMVFTTDGKDVGIATFKIDVSDKPIKRDVTYVGGPRDAQTLPGIFRLAHERFIGYFSYPGAPRPTSLESTAANRYFLSIDRKKTD